MVIIREPGREKGGEEGKKKEKRSYIRTAARMNDYGVLVCHLHPPMDHGALAILDSHLLRPRYCQLPPYESLP
jgi:hypothetical protein